MKRTPTAEEAERTLDAYRRAHHFTTTILKMGGYLTERSTSLEAARGLRPALEKRAANNRKALVYAVTPDGGTHLIPDSFVP